MEKSDSPVSVMVLFMIHPSEEGCKNYFDMENEKLIGTDIIPVVKPKHSKDTLKCTTERACYATTQNKVYCHILRDCFKVMKFETEPSEECRGNTAHSVPHYHLMCLLAHAFNVTTPACEYVTTCEMYSPKSPSAPTAATTAATTATTTTTATSTAATSNSPSASVTNPKPSAISGCNGEFLQIYFKISLIFNIFGIIGIIVYCMRRLGLLNCTQTEKAHSGGGESENQTMMRCAITHRPHRTSEEECSSES